MPCVGRARHPFTNARHARSWQLLSQALAISLIACVTADRSYATGIDDWHTDAPGHTRRISAADLPAPYATASSANQPSIVRRPSAAKLAVPAGFQVQAFATGLKGPRRVCIAPNGDIFVAETHAGRVRVLRAAAGAAKPSKTGLYASGLNGPFGMAFYPLGRHPHWLYVATNNQVLRFAYHSGDMHARSAAEILVAQLAESSAGHSTRDIVFAADASRMFVSVGSGSNVAEVEARKSAQEILEWEAAHGLGAAWGGEANRADVLVFDTDGKASARIFATGIRNCVGLAVQPHTGDLWCTTNERDGLGDDLVPDYTTRVHEGAFYGWPWYYLGSHQDPRHAGERPDLADKVTQPDVLFQAHSASLTLAFYDATSGVAAFPREYVGDAFVAMHGSWNRSHRTGYKVVRVRLKDGAPTGEYEDFLTGFVVDDDQVWGRPVGVAVARDGALLVSDDASNTLWRVTPVKQ
jgi:glucose/arabinose dehydrogenase